MTAQTFQKKIKDFYKKNRRDLPWRTSHDPYRILVSEVMLQQTGVERVMPKYESFIKKWPTAKALSRADTKNVLQMWSGLGYNRRALYLHRAVGEIVSRFKNKFPDNPRELETLPGIGPYTARAIAAFAFNRPDVFIETNIRAVFVYEFFAGKKRKIKDDEILALVEKTLDRKNPREWYAALMDYGSYLKRAGLSKNTRHANYTKQSTFKGSLREVRGGLMKYLLSLGGSVKLEQLLIDLPFPKLRIEKALETLLKEGLVKTKRGHYYV